MPDNEMQMFYEELMGEVKATSNDQGNFYPDSFFEIAGDQIVESGDLPVCERYAYRDQTGRIQVDGAGGDPIESSADPDAGGILNLIVLDFVQSEKYETLPGSRVQQKVLQTQRFITSSLTDSWKQSLDDSTPGFELAEIIHSRWKYIKRIRITLLTNKFLSTRVESLPTDEIEGRNVTYSVWDISRLHRFNTSGLPHEPIEIDLLKEGLDTIPVISVNSNSDIYESYLAVISGTQLASIYDKWQDRLLEQNVRVFLTARGSVNKGLKRTLELEPEMFFAYNNGITCTATEIEFNKDKTNITKLTNLQIVNGAQTCASIYHAQLNKNDISAVSVQMKLSVVEALIAEEHVPLISQYSNSQNTVNAADFFANHPFHQEMEKFSRRLYTDTDGINPSKWFYERARGSYNNSKSAKFLSEYPKHQKFVKTDLAKYINVWEQKPHIVSLGAQKNFADFAKYISKIWKSSDNNQDLFNDLYYKKLIGKAIIFKHTERLVSDAPWYNGGYRANVVAYSISKLAFDIKEKKKGYDFVQIWNKQVVPTGLNEYLLNSTEIIHEFLTRPRQGISNVTELAKRESFWNEIRDSDVTWNQTLDKELLDIEEIKEETKVAKRQRKSYRKDEIQIKVVEKGNEFWSDVLDWGNNKGLLSEKDRAILSTASDPNRLPTVPQCMYIQALMVSLDDLACPHQFS